MSFIHPSAQIAENVILEEDVYIGPFCIIGFPPEDKGHFPNSPFGVRIKSGAKLTGHVTVDAGTIKDTVIGENNFLMKGVHLGHDVVMEKNTILSCHAILGGHVYVQEGANLGLGCIVHPRQVIGAYSMIGMGAIVPKKAIVEPGQIFVGNPARKIGQNQRGLDKNAISKDQLNELIKKFELLKA